MSGKSKHRNTQEYLRYLKGELSREERHAFERDLEADPFLQEAMEGMEALDPRELEEDLLSIHGNLQKRLSRRRRIRWYYAAASVASLLIVGTIFLTIYNVNPKTASESIPNDESFLHEERSTETGAAVKESLKEAEVPVPEITAEEPAAQDRGKVREEAGVPEMQAAQEKEEDRHRQALQQEEAMEVAEAGEDAEGGQVAEDEKAEEAMRVAEPVRAMAQEPAPEEQEMVAVEAQPLRSRKKTEVENEVIPEQDAAISAKAAVMPEQKAAIPEQREAIPEQRAAIMLPDAGTQAQGRKVSGIVVSAENQEPLPGASIRVKGIDSGLVADTDGRFTLVSDQQAPPTVVASFIGMKPGEYKLDENKENRLVLQPDPKIMNEVVVMDSEDLDRFWDTRAIQNISDDNQVYTYQGAEPEGGLEAFKMYIEEQIRFPAGDTLNQRGVVVLKFNVSTEGTISGIQTLRSPGEPFTREAIMLLQQGPSWKPARDENGPTDDVVRMRIVFKK